MDKKIQILEQLAAGAGEYYGVNLSQNRILGSVFQTVDGKRYDVNALTGIPVNAPFTEYLDYWGKQLPEEERAAFYSFFDISRLLSLHQQGDSHQIYTYWTCNALGSPVLAEQHVVMYTEDETGDVLAVVNTFNRTQRYYSRKYLDVLSQNYILAYRVNLNTDLGEVLKLDSHAHVGNIPGIRPGGTFRFRALIERFAQDYVTSDKQEFLRVLSGDYLERKLQSSPRFFYRFDTIPNRKGNCHYEMQIVSANPKAYDGCFILTSEEIDDIVQEEDRWKAEVEQEREYLNVMTRDCTVVYHVNLLKDTSVAIKVSQKMPEHRKTQNDWRTPNPYWEKIQQYSRLYVAPVNREEFLRVMSPENIQSRLRLTQRFAYRYQTLPTDGKPHFFETAVYRMNEDGIVSNVLVAFRCVDEEVTEEHRRRMDLEERMEREQHQLEILRALSASYSAIFSIDLAQDCYEKITCVEKLQPLFVNRLSAAETMMYVCDHYITPQHQSKMARFLDLRTLARRLEGESVIEDECMTLDGNWYRTYFIPKRRNEKGEVTDVLYVVRLISDEKMREKLLISMAEEAKRSNQAKTDFISRVAHDIRTPLNSVFGFLEIAKANINDPEKVGHSLEMISTAGKFLKALIDDVLDISRMENNKMTLTPEELSLSQLVGELSDLMGSYKPEKQMNFRFICENVTCDRVMADPLRLKQIYMNILTNAVNYTPAGGKIDFVLRQEEIPNRSRVAVEATISDTGIGMSEDFMKRMFTRFERGTDTRVNKVSGYGLGLSVVKQLVELMEGTITADSQLNKGTTFHIRLELPVAETKTEAVQKETVLSYRGMKALVAEDNELNREIITELLEIEGITCDCAEDGALCLERFRTSAPGTYDVILMDMQMPNMNGIEATSAIRRLPRADAKTIPIFAMTANALAEDVKACLDAGMNRHFSKPIDLKALLTAFSQINRRGK